MIILPGPAFGEGKRKGLPPAMNIHVLSYLCGVAIYLFMCHHSLPFLVNVKEEHLLIVVQSL